MTVAGEDARPRTGHHVLARFFGAHSTARLHVLHNPAFRRLWLARLVSTMGSFAQAIAIAWLILRAGKGPSLLGLAIALGTLPSVVMTLYGGVLADVISRGRLIVASQVVLTANAVLLAVLSAVGDADVAVLVISVTVSGAFGALATPALRAITRDVVGEADLAPAVSLTSLEFNVAKVLGPALAGALLGVAGATACFAVNAVSFAAMIAVIPTLGVRASRQSAHGHRAARELGEAVGVARRTPAITTVLIVVFGVGLFGFNIAVMAPLIARYLLNGTPADFAVVTAAAGAGSVAAALATLPARRVTMRRAMLGAAAMSVALFGLGVVTLDRPGTIAAMFVFGFSGTIMLTAASTLVQLLAPAGVEGRILALYLLGVVGTTPLGSLLLGLLAARFGIADALTVMGAASIATVVLAALYGWRRRTLGATVPAIGPWD